MVRSCLFLPILFLAFHLGWSAPSPAGRPDTAQLPCRQKAEKLLDEVLGFMEHNYYRKDEIFWPGLSAQAKQRLQESSTCEDAYSTVGWCLKQLREPHSFIMPPDRAARYIGDAIEGDGPAALTNVVGEIKGEWLQDSIGYLTVPWVNTEDSLLCERIADSLQSVIARLDTRHISRWIIDLRQNSGGNCWPMLAGIGPLIGEGVYGYFVAAGAKVPISYYDGSAFQGKHVRCCVSHHGYRPKNANSTIVVLTGSRTISAGETVALAFRGRQQTLLMGQPTRGLTTANATYTLSDQSMLVLTVCQEADRTGQVCQGSIRPDQYVPADGQTTDDPARTAALAWLQRQ